MAEGGGEFERRWQAKLARGIEAAADERVLASVMAGGADLSAQSPPERIAAWTRAALDRLVQSVGEARAGEILTSCACSYPPADLRRIRERYRQTGDVDAARRKLQDNFEILLRRTLRLPEEAIAEVVRRGWGPAGVRGGRRIVATKIPKSETLADYLDEADPARRRTLYCHCPRVRAAAAGGTKLPAIYCYCGAGYYRKIWEAILERPVKVELLESVLQGGDECRVAINLPEGTDSAPAAGPGEDKSFSGMGGGR
ncbi:MAG: hypothetical protein JW929_04160 [Anaerolineales bacterium]|nr:hypothetical protein [Anaerolineales bacterium]